MKVGCHEEVERAPALQVYLTLEDNHCQEHNDVDEQQIFGDSRYVTKHLFIYDLTICNLLFDYLRLAFRNLLLTTQFARKITKNICFSAQKRAKTHYFS